MAARRWPIGELERVRRMLDDGAKIEAVALAIGRSANAIGCALRVEKKAETKGRAITVTLPARVYKGLKIAATDRGEYVEGFVARLLEITVDASLIDAVLDEWE
jgi:hypothetical protein